MSDDISKLAFALSKFQGSLGSVIKNKTATIPTKSGGKYSYTYADISAICDAIKDPLMQNELAISQNFFIQGNEAHIITVLMHSSGQWIKSSLPLNVSSDMKEMAGSITYLRRYCISSILCISTDDDNEEEDMLNKKAAPLPAKKEEPKPVQKKGWEQFTSAHKEDILKAIGDDEDLYVRVDAYINSNTTNFEKVMKNIEGSKSKKSEGNHAA